MICQQALNIMFHQRIQAADKSGQHAQNKQRDTPPQRYIDFQR